MQTTTPRCFGRYEVRGTLARGGMGVVYRAWDPLIGRHVAIKAVRLFADSDAEEIAEALARFRREARAAGLLSHPGIVVVHDFGQEDQTPYLAMELLEGEDLAQVLQRRGPCPLGAILATLEQLCAALDHAHDRDVIHRDLKPANIFLTADGRVKITDFGVAHLQDERITRTGFTVGSPPYMSPEQLLGRPLDRRSDLFSLAVMIYEMLTGRLPFAAATDSSMAYRTLHELPHHLELEPTALSARLDAVLGRAMEKRAQDRFENAAAFLAAFREALAESDGAAGSRVVLAAAALTPAPAGTAGTELAPAPPALPLPDEIGSASTGFLVPELPEEDLVPQEGLGDAASPADFQGAPVENKRAAGGGHGVSAAAPAAVAGLALIPAPPDLPFPEEGSSVATGLVVPELPEDEAVPPAVVPPAVVLTTPLRRGRRPRRVVLAGTGAAIALVCGALWMSRYRQAPDRAEPLAGATAVASVSTGFAAAPPASTATAPAPTSAPTFALVAAPNSPAALSPPPTPAAGSEPLDDAALTAVAAPEAKPARLLIAGSLPIRAAHVEIAAGELAIWQKEVVGRPLFKLGRKGVYRVKFEGTATVPPGDQMLVVRVTDLDRKHTFVGRIRGRFRENRGRRLEIGLGRADREVELDWAD